MLTDEQVAMLKVLDDVDGLTGDIADQEGWLLPSQVGRLLPEGVVTCKGGRTYSETSSRIGKWTMRRLDPLVNARLVYRTLWLCEGAICWLMYRITPAGCEALEEEALLPAGVPSAGGPQ